TASMRQRIVDDVETHAQRLFALFGRIVMNVFILEAVTEVRVVRIEYNQPSIVNNAVALRGPSIVLMNLRQSVREFVKTMKNGMRIRDLDQRCLGEDAAHFAAKRRIDSEVVVHPPKSPGRQVSAHVRHFGGGELDVAVAAREQERVLEEGGGRRFHHGFTL